MKAPLVIIAAILWLAGCSESPRKTEANGAPVPVKTVTVAAESWPEEYEAMGTVHARTTAVESSKVMGYVREVHANIGDRVSRRAIARGARCRGSGSELPSRRCRT